jgi:hypothetical protein
MVVATALAMAAGWSAKPAAASVTAQEATPDPRFGAVGAIWAPEAAAEANVGYERILFTWSHLQPEGPEDWNFHTIPEEWLAQAEEAGREVIAVLIGTPAWATDGLPTCGVPRGLELPLDDPGNLWARFVRMAVERYVGRITHWIIWNEPEIKPGSPGLQWCGTVEEYYLLMKVGYLAAHEANPNVKVHMAGYSHFHDKGWLSRLLDVAMLDSSGAEHGYYFDVVPLHIYFQSWQVPNVISETRATLQSYGLEKPIWVNETNAGPTEDPQWPLYRYCWQVTLDDQAGFLLQSFALALASGAERVAVYQWFDYGLEPGGEPYGVIRPDHTRRPAYDAYRLITTHYAGTISASVIVEDLFYQVTLDRGDQTTRVLWASTDVALSVAVPALAGEALLFSQLGENVAIQPSEGSYLITLPAARCPEEDPGCIYDHPACIIGGTTYLLVEAASGQAGAPSVVETGLLLTPTPTPSPTPTPTPTPTVTPRPRPTQTPTRTPAKSPTATAAPTAAPEPAGGGSWGVIAGTTVAAFLIAALAAWQVRRPRRAEGEDPEGEQEE